MSTRRERKTSGNRYRKRSTLEDTLLNQGEKAAFLATVISDDDNDIEEDVSCPYRCRYYCSIYCCNKGLVGILVALVILLVGVAVFGASHMPSLQDKHLSNNNDSYTVGEVMRTVSSFVISAGLFGVAGGVVNLLAIIMLFQRIRPLYGTGVMERQHQKIGEILRMIILQMLFDSERLENYVKERIGRFSVEVNIVHTITKALSSSSSDRIIEAHLDNLYSQPESYYLKLLGITRSRLKPMIVPAMLSLCSETGPQVIEKLAKKDSAGHPINVPLIRQTIDHYLKHRLRDLTGSRVSELMRDLMLQHFTGLALIGAIAGCLVGAAAQGLRITINPEQFV